MAAATFYDFVTAINAHDTDRLYTLMSRDHSFVDATGKKLSGADAAKAGWLQVFEWFPDYELELAEAMENSHLVMATGHAKGTYLGIPGHHWKIPIALKSQIRADEVTLWQIFGDTKIPLDVVTRYQGAQMTADEGRRATSLGGVFFKCKEPEKLRDWYTQYLGLKTDTYGTSFAWKQWADSGKKGFTAWSPFPLDTTYFAPSDKDFMLNYRVDHLESLVAKLKAEGVTILDEIASYPYGKFVHILDPENNKVELWEADDEAYAKMLEAMTF